MDVRIDSCKKFSNIPETISRHFHNVLTAVLKMSVVIIRPDDNYNDHVPEYISSNPKYSVFKVLSIFCYYISDTLSHELIMI